MEWSDLAAWCGRIRSIDLLCVWRATSEACRLEVPGPKLPELAEFAATLGLSFVVGWDAVPEGGTECAAATVHGSPRRTVYLAGEVRAAQRMRRWDEHGHALRCHEAAGVPACCAEGLSGTSTDELLLQRYPDDHPINWAMNVSLADLDCALLSWVPCSPDCSAALGAAYRRFELLREIAPSLAMQLASVLCTTVLTARRLGVVAFQANAATAGTIVGQPLVATGCLGEVVRAGASIVREPGGLVVERMFLPTEWSRLYHHV
jgi:hypothetical protein